MFVSKTRAKRIGSFVISSERKRFVIEDCYNSNCRINVSRTDVPELLMFIQQQVANSRRSFSEHSPTREGLSHASLAEFTDQE